MKIKLYEDDLKGTEPFVLTDETLICFEGKSIYAEITFDHLKTISALITPYISNMDKDVKEGLF